MRLRRARVSWTFEASWLKSNVYPSKVNVSSETKNDFGKLIEVSIAAARKKAGADVDLQAGMPAPQSGIAATKSVGRESWLRAGFLAFRRSRRKPARTPA